MATEYITKEGLLAFIGKGSPSQIEDEWAQKVTDAINEGIDQRLNGAAVTNPVPAELVTAAYLAGSEAFRRREASFGSTGYSDMEGTATRLARDYLDSIAPVINRYNAGPGIG
jgi:hypothetical protein